MFSWTQTSAGCAVRAAQLQRLEHERRDVEIAGLAAVGDLLHLHEAVARRPPGLVGLGLLLQHALEIGRPLLELRRLLASDAPGASASDREADGATARATQNEAAEVDARTRRSYTVPDGVGGARVRARQPVAQLVRGFGRGLAVKRHQRGRHTRDAHDVGAPAILRTCATSIRYGRPAMDSSKR